MLGNLANGINIFKIADAAAAGTDASVVASSAIDAATYDRLLVIMRVGATATNLGELSLSVSEGETSTGDFTAITGAAIAHTFGSSGETNKFHIIDTAISKRYVKVSYQRETQNSALIACWAILYNGKKLPEETPSEVKNIVVV